VTAGPAPPLAPAFWFRFEVPWAKLVVARVLVFGVLALDAVLQLRHAPRYGVDGFDVAQLHFLDGYGPTRVSFGASELVIAACLVFAALGVATRVVLPIATALYAWVYFGSQVDSYQHHYLVVLLLAIACFVPWQRPADASAATPVASWAVRLILVELAILYLWAAISKLDPAWLDGRTLGRQLGAASGTALDRLSMVSRLVEATVGWQVCAVGVLACELVLAATVWHRRGWVVAAPLGAAFHAGIALTSLDIGLFAYVMIAVYALVVPDAVWVAVARHAIGPRVRRAWAALPRGPVAAVVLAVAAAVAIAVCRLPGAAAVGGVVACGTAGLVVLRVRRKVAVAAPAAALACVAGLWLGVDRLSPVTSDYFRLWGGASRRLGDLDAAERAYGRFVELEPDSVDAHLKHGRALLDLDRGEDAIVELDAARALAPHDARPWLEQARWLARHARRDEALAAARAGASAQPDNPEARALVDALADRGASPLPARDE
jgi:hypothetical protein